MPVWSCAQRQPRAAAALEATAATAATAAKCGRALAIAHRSGSNRTQRVLSAAGRHSTQWPPFPLHRTRT
eukprot:2806566-Prymnesium_polylepis.1